MSPDSVPGLGTTCLARVGVGVAGVMRPGAPFLAFCRADVDDTRCVRENPRLADVEGVVAVDSPKVPTSG